MLILIGELNGQKIEIPVTADTGVGAPVGSIIVVCSNILPSGYLGLGVQYDITNYPALYQVLGTDTTPTASALGLPTLSSGQYAIKATSGLTENQQENVLNTINENNSYSTEEHPTGKKWIDGKPIYEKTIKDSNINTTPKVLYTIPNLSSIVKIQAVYKSSTNIFPAWYAGSSGFNWARVDGNNLIWEYGSGTGAPEEVTVTIEYTKTTDN